MSGMAMHNPSQPVLSNSPMGSLLSDNTTQQNSSWRSETPHSSLHFAYYIIITEVVCQFSIILLYPPPPQNVSLESCFIIIEIKKYHSQYCKVRKSWDIMYLSYFIYAYLNDKTTYVKTIILIHFKPYCKYKFFSFFSLEMLKWKMTWTGSWHVLLDSHVLCCLITVLKASGFAYVDESVKTI